MKKLPYSEKLKNPLWQKKRLSVLSRDEFKCCLCKDDKTELHVHHLSYMNNPWDVDLSQLQTLCKDCHKLVTFLEKNDKWEVDFITDIIKVDGNVFICVLGSFGDNTDFMIIEFYPETNEFCIKDLLQIGYIKLLLAKFNF